MYICCMRRPSIDFAHRLSGHRPRVHKFDARFKEPPWAIPPPSEHQVPIGPRKEACLEYVEDGDLFALVEKVGECFLHHSVVAKLGQDESTALCQDRRRGVAVVACELGGAGWVTLLNLKKSQEYITDRAGV